MCKTIHTTFGQKLHDTFIVEPVVGERVKSGVRMLTPREDWRLMGFTDDDFDKVANIGISNTQLIHQAGNSIVVQVLEAVLKALFLTDWGKSEVPTVKHHTALRVSNVRNELSKKKGGLL